MMKLEIAGPQSRLACFAGNWVPGTNAASWSQRRRLMSLLRMAHRIMGLGRKRLGLGQLAFGSRSPRTASIPRGGFIVASGIAFVTLVGGVSGTAHANTLPSSTTCTSGGSGGTPVGTIAPGNTNSQPVDGSGTFSTVAGCNANGNDALAVTAFGAFSNGNGKGATAIGFNSSAAADWTSALGLESRATGVGSTALGFGSQATGLNTVAIGGAGGDGTTPLSVADSTTASGAGSIAIGSNATRGAQATGTDSIALGGQSTGTGDGTVAIGVASTAVDNFSIAVGNLANAQGIASAALGSGATTNGVGATALGNNAHASADSSFAGGRNATAGGANSIAIGGDETAGANASGASSIAIGYVASATGPDSIAVGTGNLVSGASSGAFGDPNTVTGTGSYAFGNNNTVSADNAFVLGNGVDDNVDNSVVLGNGSTAAVANTAYYNPGSGALSGTATSVVSVGAIGAERQITNVAPGSSATDAVNVSQLQSLADTVASTATHYYSVNDGGTTGDNYDNDGAAGTDSLAAGVGASATSASGTALGNGASVNRVGGIALGHGATVGGAATAGLTDTVGVSIGAGTQTDWGVAIGDQAKTATGSYGVSIGRKTTAALRSTALGFQANASGTGAVAIGDAVASGATAAGAGAVAINGTAVADGSVALGSGASASQVGSVALGSGSTTSAAVATPSATINGTTYNFAGGAPTSVVSVGNGAAQRQIQNVAAGQISGASTDAINGSQLFATNQAVEAAAAAANAGWNVTTAATGTGTASGTSVANVAPGSTQTVTAGNNIAITQDGTNLSIATNPNLVSDSLTTGNTVVDNGGIAVSGGPNGTVSLANSGLDNGGNTISNVADGALAATSTDAVNGSQLYATNQQVTQNAGDIATNATNIAGNTTAITNLGDNVADGTIGTVQRTGTAGQLALTAPGGSGAAPGAAQRLSNVAAGTAATDAVNVSQLADATSGVTTAGLDFTGNDNSAGDVHRDLGQALAIQGAATTAGTYSAGNIQTVTDPATGAITIQMADAPTFGGVTVNAGGTGKITGVTAGTDATDAVNVSQLDAVSAVADNAVQYDDAAHDSVTLGGTGAAAPVGLHNVADGALAATSTDAVNGSQLYATNQQVTQNAGDIATNATNIAGNTTAITNLGAQTTVNTGDIAALQQDALQWNPGLGAYDASHGSGSPQKITNVADGDLSATSSDAVNGSQLFATNQQVDQNTTDIAGNTTAVNNVTSVVNAINNGAGIKYFHANSSLADSQAVGTDSVAVGPAAVADGAESVALGNGTLASVDGSIALGAGSTADRALAPVSGTIPAATGYIPYNTSDATLLGSVSVGDATSGSYRQITNVADGTSAQDAVTIRQLQGAIASVATTGSLYFHANSSAGDSLAVGQESVAVGPTTIVNGDNGIGIGNGAVVGMTAPGGTAIGEGAEVSQADAIAMGTDAKADGIQSLALGAGADASYSGSVALGAGATTSVGSQTGYVAYGLAAPQNSAGEVSVGSAGAERQITNVAAGSAETDAVNVAQLNQVAQNAADTLGGGAGYDPTTGTYTSPSYAIGGATYDNVGDALAAQGDIVSAQGDSIVAQLGGGTTYDPATGMIGGGFTVNGTHYGDVASAIGSVAAVADNAVQYDDPAHDSVTLGGTGASAPVALHNVAAGDVSARSTDAINGSQLNATNQQVAQNAADIAGNTAAITNLGNQTTQNAGDIANLSDGIANGTVGLVQQTGGAPGNGQITVGAMTGGTSVSVAGTDGDRVISGVADGVAPDDAVNVSQLAAAITSASQNAVAYDDAGHTSVTFNPGGQAAGLHNVAAGEVADGSTDAVNGSQLYATNQQVADNTTQITAIDNGEAGPFRSNNTSGLAAPSATGDDAVAGGFGAVASGTHATALGAGAQATGNNSVALGYGSTDDGRDNVVSVGSAGAERQITNVAAGTQDTDAVNVGQLNSGLASTLNQANAYTDSRLNALTYDLGKARRDADAGTASALAAAALPQAFTPGKGMIAGGIGAWRDETAFAIGMSKAFNDGHTIVKGGATFTSRSDTFGANVGVGYQF